MRGAKIYKNIENTKSASIKDQARRFVQTLTVVLYINVFIYIIFFSIISTPFLLFYFNNIGRLIFLIYLALIYIDNTTHFFAVKGNGWLFFRDNWMTQHIRDYFPIEIVKTAELEPTRNYVLASFPHGLTCTGIATNMSYNIGNWLQLFPGVRPKLATLNIYFYTPILREIFRLWGFVSCTKESLEHYLSKSNDPQHKDNKDGFTSNAVAISVGGVREGLDSRPGQYIFTLKNRKGFVKLAIKTGSAIVPTISFGEVDIWEPVENPLDLCSPKFRNYQLVFIRQLLKYSFGFLPKRKRVVCVVGAPIEVKNVLEADAKYVDGIHQVVIDSLTDLFEKFKHKYIENADEVKLVIN